MQKEIIFDFDNSLVKTNDFVARHLVKTCIKLGQHCPTKEEIIAMQKRNLSFEEMFNQWFGADKSVFVLETYRADAMTTNYEATDGGIEFVQNRFEKGIPMVIASNRTKMLAERLAQAGYEQKWFLGIVECDPKKPVVGAYNKALEKLKTPETIIIVGDHTDDFLACPQNMRSNFVAVTTGLTTKEEFLAVGVDEQNIWPNLKHQNRLAI